MDLSKLLPSGAAVVSGVVMLLWGAHVLGYAPSLTPDNAEVLKAAVYTVLGYWVGAATIPAHLRQPVESAAAPIERLVEGSR